MDIAKLIIHQARSREQDPAIAFSGGVATYGMLVRAVDSAGDQLDRLGFAAGSIVGIDTRNPFHHVALILALELRGIATASVQTSFNAVQAGLQPVAILVAGTTAHDGSGVRTIAIDGGWFSTDLETPPRFEHLLALPGFGNDAALSRVVFSSGATGVPKSTGFTPGIIERRIGHNLMAIGGAAGMRLGTMMGFSTLPGYMLPMTALTVGGTICFGSSPADMLHLGRSLRVDIQFAAVAQLDAMLTALGNARPPQLGTIAVTGSRIPQALLSRARERLSSNIVFLYGSTEAGMIAQAPAALLEAQEGVAGYVMPWVTLEVVDDEDKPLAAGTVGTIRLRTPEQAGYLGGSAENDALVRDGWFSPGDVGRMRSDGLVQVTGRSVEVINRGGSVVAPDLIEQILRQRPEVRDVAAFGVPGKSGMEEIWAAVVVEGVLDDVGLIAFCRERLADKAPDTIRRIEAIPRTESGKIRRQQIREQLAPRPA